MKVAKVNFSDSIGYADFFYGTTLLDIRYAVEGYSAFENGADAKYPEVVELHFWKCHGGDVYEGYSMYNYLRGLAKQGVSVKCYIHGLCASIATLVALAADEVYMDDAASFMVHKPMVDTGYFANADDHRKAADLLDQIQTQLVGRYVARSGGKLTEATAHALINAESWLTADQCLEHGFVTGKITDELLVPPVAAGKALNYFKPQTPQNMALTAEEKKGFLADVKEMFTDMLKGFKNEAPVTPTNTTVQVVSDGTTLYVDAAGDNIAQGDMVYTDADLTVAAADGSYPLEDGRSIDVAAGAITAITEATNTTEGATEGATDLAAANNRIAELEAELAAEKGKVSNVTNTVRTLQNKLREVPGSAGNPNTPGIQNTATKAAGATGAKSSPFNITRT